MSINVFSNHILKLIKLAEELNENLGNSIVTFIGHLLFYFIFKLKMKLFKVHIHQRSIVKEFGMDIFLFPRGHGYKGNSREYDNSISYMKINEITSLSIKVKDVAIYFQNVILLISMKSSSCHAIINTVEIKFICMKSACRFCFSVCYYVVL